MINTNSNVNQTFKTKTQLLRILNEKPKKKSTYETETPTQNNNSTQYNEHLTRFRIEKWLKIPTAALSKSTKNPARRKGNVTNSDNLSNAVLSTEIGNLENNMKLSLGKERKM